MSAIKEVREGNRRQESLLSIRKACLRHGGLSRASVVRSEGGSRGLREGSLASGPAKARPPGWEQAQHVSAQKATWLENRLDGERRRDAGLSSGVQQGSDHAGP